MAHPSGDALVTRRHLPEADQTLWASGPRKAAQDGDGRAVQSVETPASARRRMAVASVIRHGSCTSVHRNGMKCRLKLGHEIRDHTHHEGTGVMRWPPIPAPTCSCDDFTPASVDGLVLGCSACGEIVWPWPPPGPTPRS